MDLIISLEQRFHRTPDGAVWSDAAFDNRFWNRYLEVFDEVRVAARVEAVESVPGTFVRADGERVSFIPVPYYVGPVQYAWRLFQIRSAIRNVDCEDCAVIMRVPSIIAGHMARKLYRTGQPFGVEVVGDPFDVFAPGAIKHPLRPYFRWSVPRQLREQCRRASAAAYVTQYTLQRRYPCLAYADGISDIQLPSEALLVDNVLSTFFSSVELDGKAYVSGRCRRNIEDLRILTVGSLEQPYKGVHDLLAALDICVRQGLHARLTVVGDGRYRPSLEKQAAALGLSDHVEFLGKLPAGAGVRSQMDSADLFVLASLTEGLPRVIVEAMARAMPVIATSVGGIPELLPPEDLVPPGDPKALAAKIAEVARDGARITRMADRNLARAHQFHESVLRDRRLAFYRHLRSVMEEWRLGRAGGDVARSCREQAAF
jgi:glycosyltransferase involved in cell wall biosynthesis